MKHISLTLDEWTRALRPIAHRAVESQFDLFVGESDLATGRYSETRLVINIIVLDIVTRGPTRAFRDHIQRRRE